MPPRRENTIVLINPEEAKVGFLELDTPCPHCGGKRRQMFIPKAGVRAVERLRGRERDVTIYKSVIVTTCEGCDDTVAPRPECECGLCLEVKRANEPTEQDEIAAIRAAYEQRQEAADDDVHGD